nr:response regulator [Desulfobulbaceae bacterium]
MTPPNHKPVVLVIDDDEVNRVVLSKILSKENIEVHAASDGKQGWAKAKAMIPDLVLLDIFMPGEDGFEVLARFKSTPELCEVPVCIFSILEREESKKKAFDLGAYAYLAKPFDMKEVVDQVKNILAAAPEKKIAKA